MGNYFDISRRNYRLSFTLSTKSRGLYFHKFGDIYIASRFKQILYVDSLLQKDLCCIVKILSYKFL